MALTLIGCGSQLSRARLQAGNRAPDGAASDPLTIGAAGGSTASSATATDANAPGQGTDSAGGASAVTSSGGNTPSSDAAAPGAQPARASGARSPLLLGAIGTATGPIGAQLA